MKSSLSSLSGGWLVLAGGIALLACSDAGGGDRYANGATAPFGPSTPQYSPGNGNAGSTGTGNTSTGSGGTTSATTGNEGNPVVSQPAPNLNETGSGNVGSSRLGMAAMGGEG